MKAASIRYRVADFLKQHAPFEHVEEEDLLQLVDGGRVKFHEGLEYVYEQGQSRGPYLFVIQQGTVQLLRRGEDGEELADLRGEGDLLGIGHFLGSEHHQHSARTCTDVILYAIPVDAFDKVVKKYPAVQRHMAAYNSLSTADDEQNTPGDQRSASPSSGRSDPFWHKEHLPSLRVLRARMVTGRPDTAVREIAQRMSERGCEIAVILDDESGVPVGTLSDANLRDCIARGENPSSVLAREISSPVIAAAGGLSAHEYAAEMARIGSSHLLLTENGAANGRFIGMITESDLVSACGHHPQMVVRRIQQSNDIVELSWLRQCADVVLERALVDRSALDWVSPVMSRINSTLLCRVADLTSAEVARDTDFAAERSCCLVVFGSAARGEMLQRSDLQIGVVYADGGDDPAGPRYQSLAAGIEAALQQCGFSLNSTLSPFRPTVRSLSAWKEAFSGWVRDPIVNETYNALPYLDMLWVWGSFDIARQLRLHLEREVNASRGFIPLLANDCLENLPPLTFFRGLVVADEDTHHEGLDLERCALRPLVDVGRVLALAVGRTDLTSTLARLRGLADISPKREALTGAAQEAFRIALYYQTLNRLREGSGAALIDPSRLDKYDQQVLKAAFRSILEVIETTTAYFQSPSRA